MKLLYLHNVPLDSERANIIQVLYMCDAFSKLGVDVKLAIPASSMPMNNRNISTLVQEKIGRTNNYPIILFPRYTIAGRFSSLGGYFSIKKILKKTETDICFVRIPLYLQLSMKAGIPTIFEFHNSLLHTRSKIMDKYWKRKLIKYAQSDKLLKFLTISQALSDHWVRNGIPFNKQLALHDGIDEEEFKNTKTRDEARKELGLISNEKMVLYAGSMYPDRGIEDILKLAKIFSTARFFVLGGPEDSKRYFEMKIRDEKISNINFKGWVPREIIKNYLFAADILLMIWTRKVPTINYCSPLKMFEYMAVGRIIVGHAFPTIKEVLTDGYTAYLVDPDSFQELCEKLKKALNDNYPSEMAKRARTLALKKYTWNKRASKIIDSITYK